MLIRSILLFAMLLLPSAARAQSGGRIERLTPPNAPRTADPDTEAEDEQMTEDLERKRRQRETREERSRPPEQPYAVKRAAKLMKEAKKPHDHKLLVELALVGSGVTVRGDKSGYTSEPNTHFNAIYRMGQTPTTGDVNVWTGLRVAPFVGTGFYKKRPGAYGLTYFGPMVGVGKIDPLPRDSGQPKAASASGRSAAEIPTANGWLVTTGIAAVSKAGSSESTDKTDKDNDFGTQGVTFDSPGLWLEARWLHVMYGAFGFDVVAGAQSGKSKVFVYAGIGAAAWY